MKNENYELRIISKDQGSSGKVLKKYIIDGQETVGVEENEPFEIEFKNKTWSKLQIRLSVDGTDISTGALASTSPEGEMFLCEPYGTVRLKAWPESSKGGAEFLFSKVEDSVAANTHGNISGKGIIAAAIFVEGYSVYAVPTAYGGITLAGGNHGYVFNSTIGSNSLSLGSRKSMIRSNSLGEEKTKGGIARACMDSMDMGCELSEESLAVGAGNYVDQKIVKVAGLVKPILSTTISVKYESWNSLRSKVRALQKSVVNVSNPAFPGDVPLEVKMIDLKNTPKGRKKPARTPDLQRF